MDECAAAADRGCHEASQIHRDLRDLLCGPGVSSVRTYPCRFDGRHHWYQVAMTTLPESDRARAIVMHTDVTALQHDHLTGLPNRALFEAQLGYVLDKCRANGQTASLLVVDLDGFKAVNDSLGHLAGDRVLVAVAERLQAAVRPADLVARLGGDEFAVVLADGTDRNTASVVADRVAKALDQPFPIGEHRIRVGASIGIAHYPQAGETDVELIAAADLSMYQVKRAKPGAIGAVA